MKTREEIKNRIECLRMRSSSLAETINRQFTALVSEKRRVTLHILYLKEKQLRLKIKIESLQDQGVDSSTHPSHYAYIAAKLEYENIYVRILTLKAAKITFQTKIINLNQTVITLLSRHDFTSR